MSASHRFAFSRNGRFDPFAAPRRPRHRILRVVLGLAGVALRSGARSALASLWFVNDDSTAELSSRFYENLITRKMTRADSLRAAQVAMIRDERYAHPAYWAPFLMIGSWL